MTTDTKAEGSAKIQIRKAKGVRQASLTTTVRRAILAQRKDYFKKIRKLDGILKAL